MQFICYPKCTTCQKAKKWLEENGIAFDEQSAAEEVLQHQRSAIQGIAAQGQTADHERGRAA